MKTDTKEDILAKEEAMDKEQEEQDEEENDFYDG